MYDFINQLIYIDISKEIKLATNRDIVYKLVKDFYNLKQSPHFWYKKPLCFFFKKLRLRYINIDYSIFVTNSGLDKPIISTFINNIKIMVPKKKWNN